MTYTVAATREMRSRFAARFGQGPAGRMAFRTINGLSAVVLQYYSRRYGRQQPRLVTDEGELTRLLTQLYMSVSSDYPTESTLKELRTVITYIKNSMLDEEGVAALETGLPDLPALYRRYQAELKRRGWMDYDDQMVYALQILRACLLYTSQRPAGGHPRRDHPRHGPRRDGGHRRLHCRLHPRL